jgi:hypothetical protein
MNYKRNKNKKRKDRRHVKMSGWGKGATRQNKIYYGFDKHGDSGVMVALPPVMRSV